MIKTDCCFFQEAMNDGGLNQYCKLYKKFRCVDCKKYYFIIRKHDNRNENQKEEDSKKYADRILNEVNYFKEKNKWL